MANLQDLLRSLVKVQEESGAKVAARETRHIAELASDPELVERIERFGPVDGDGGDRAVGGEQDRFVGQLLLPVRRDAVVGLAAVLD